MSANDPGRFPDARAWLATAPHLLGLRLAMFLLMAAMGLAAPVAWGGLSAVGTSFSPSTIAVGSTATLTITIQNKPPPGNPSDISLTDLYPANLVNAVFGARVLKEDPARPGPKYINSPQSPLFDKGNVVFGLDMARKAIVSRDERTLELLTAQVQCRAMALLADTALGPQGLAQLARALGPEFRDLGWLASDRGDIGAVKQVVDCMRELVCRAGGRSDQRAFANELNAAIGDIWKEAVVRFSDKAYAARLADLEASMNSCRLEISGVLRS